MSSFSTQCLLSAVITLAAVSSISGRAIRLYGCYLPHDPSKIEMVQFQSCIVQVNGITTGGGGRWGRDLRRQQDGRPDDVMMQDGRPDDVMMKVVESALNNKNELDFSSDSSNSLDDYDVKPGYEKRSTLAEEGFIPLENDTAAGASSLKPLNKLSLRKRSSYRNALKTIMTH